MPLIIGDIKLYSIKELSELTGTSGETLRKYLKTGRIKGQKLGKTWYATEEALRDYFNRKDDASL